MVKRDKSKLAPPRALLAGALLTLSTLAAPAAWAQEQCGVQPIRMCDGCTVSRRVTVQKDRGCVFQVAGSGEIYGLKTTVRPRNGNFGRSSSASLSAYIPKRGFVGDDYFVYVVEFEEFGKRASATVQNLVRVVDGSPF